jgi:hypothetical protein
MRRHQAGNVVDGAFIDESAMIETCAIPRVMESRLNR